MKTTKNLVKMMLMSIAAVATVMITACSDDLNEIGTSNNSKLPEDAQTALLEAYGLTYSECASNDELDEKLDWFLEGEGARILVCDVDSENNVK